MTPLVTITRRTPAARHAPMESLASVRGGSDSPTSPKEREIQLYPRLRLQTGGGSLLGTGEHRLLAPMFRGSPNRAEGEARGLD